MTQNQIIDRDYAGEGIYRENIIDHYKSPRNFGILENSDAEYMEFNPLCGDEATMQIKIKDNLIKDIKFKGKGCAISMASCSILTEKIKGKSLNEVKKLEKEQVYEMLSIPISPQRVKCALLSWETLRRLIKIYENKNG
ncbi:SUF system NifU family Fe-S cluster assembly protein [Candidatus Woesearchaeota archaeon]|nr:SUF system NifU family Fe-S cluster assembly protein [Candidatus Woesearchaeota archaeon]